MRQFVKQSGIIGFLVFEETALRHVHAVCFWAVAGDRIPLMEGGFGIAAMISRAQAVFPVIESSGRSSACGNSMPSICEAWKTVSPFKKRRVSALSPSCVELL
jgi:hypothetical protein